MNVPVTQRQENQVEIRDGNSFVERSKNISHDICAVFQQNKKNETGLLD